MAPKGKAFAKLADVLRLRVLRGTPGAEAICSGATTLLEGKQGDIRGLCSEWGVLRRSNADNRPTSELKHEVEQKVLQAARRFRANLDDEATQSREAANEFHAEPSAGNARDVRIESAPGTPANQRSGDVHPAAASHSQAALAEPDG